MVQMIAPTSPKEIAGANLIEVGRHTSNLETTYEATRAEYLQAARELQRHADRFAQRCSEFTALGGIVDPKQFHEHTEPITPAPITSKDYRAEG